MEQRAWVVGGVAAALAVAGCPLGAARAPAAPPEVRVRVTEAGTGRPLPCRLTLLDAGGRLAEFTPGTDRWLAYRTGVLYTGTGSATFSAPPGRYTLHATRGLEYGLATRSLTLDSGSRDVELRLAREVDTAGYVSCDPHIHTLTFSGHGDASVEERMATIAGEGIELAIATDHNHHTDYAPAARATHTHPHFTPVIGNEVTTPAGHFNAFPVRPGSAVPRADLTDWRALLAGVRAVPGVRVVVLNHPSNNHSGFVPTDPRRFHPASGESHDGRDWSFDGMEVVTSAALQSDWMKPYRDWFALLNYGRPVAGLGASDTHEVNRFILGQARTYVASRAARPDQIDVDEVCDHLLAGRALASMGLLTEAWVEGAGAGELARAPGREVRVRVRVQGPRWIDADRLEVFVNGEKRLSRPLQPRRGAVVKADLTLPLRLPGHDAWVVAIASGPGVEQPYWPIARPYQPTRADWEPRVLGSSAVVQVDGDGDRRYTAPREYARRLVGSAAGAAPRLVELLGAYDSAVAVQAASLWRQRGGDPAVLQQAAERGAPHVRQACAGYLNLLPAAPVR